MFALCMNVYGVRRSLVITLVAIRLQGPRFKPRPGRKFGTRLLLDAHPMFRLWDHNRANPKPENSPAASEGSIEWAKIAYVGRKEETRMKSNGM